MTAQVTDQAPLPPITGTTTVAVPIAQAFAVFTDSITAWWPHQYHIGHADIAEVVLEPGQSVHGAINGGGGWELLLAGYATTAGAQP